MMLKYLFEFEHADKNIYDGVREYCRSENICEEQFRALVSVQRKEVGKMAVVIGVLLFLLAGITVFFSVPYSKTRTEFISIRNHALIGESKDITLQRLIQFNYPLKYSA